MHNLSMDIFQLLEKDIVNYQAKGEILLCGDFNARTGVLSDFIASDVTEHLPLADDYSPDRPILTRYSRDVVIDNRGRELIDLCISSQLRFLNGRWRYNWEIYMSYIQWEQCGRLCFGLTIIIRPVSLFQCVTL